MYNWLSIIGILLLVVVAYILFFNFTMVGKSMRACAINRDAARLAGINDRSMVLLSFAMSSGIGAVAGIISSKILGRFLDQADNTAYFWAFLIAGSCYLIVLGVVHLIMPKMIPFDENLERIKEI